MKISGIKIYGFVKNIFISFFVCAIVLYLALYLGLPYFLNKKDYSKIITENIKDHTGLVLLIKDYRLSVSPKLEVNLKAGELQLFYPDKKQILDVKNAEIDISTLNLLKKEIKFNKVKANEFQFSTKLLKSGKTTFQDYLEKHVKQTRNEFSFSDKLPKIRVNKYIIKVKDEESGQKFKIAGKNFSVKQNSDFRYLDFETTGDLYCFEKKYVSYSLKLAVPKILFKEVNNVLFDISIDNLYKQNFYADLKADVKIHTKKDKFNYLSGKVDIDNFTMKLGSQKLPPSYFYVNLDKGRAALISKFYTNYNEITDINADIKIKKPYEINMQCKCKKADISNLQKLSISVFELLKIKNNISEFKASGTISSDFSIKTDLKTLKSNGNLKIKDAQISHKSIPLKVTGINATVDFSNNSVKIKQSDILVNNQPVNITGTVNPDTTGDINVSAKDLDINHIMNAFPALKPQKNLTVNSGKLSFNAKIKGKLLDAAPQINAIIKNFSATELTSKMSFSIKDIVIDAKTNKKNYSGIIKIKNFICRSKNIPNATNSLLSEEISAKFDNNDFVINPSKFTSGNAKLIVSGIIKNYSKSPNTDIQAKGTIDTNLLKSILPKTQQIYNKGYLPLKAEIKADEKSTTADIKILANPSNYITPVHVQSFLNINTLTHMYIRLEGSTLNIEDFSMYYANGLNSLQKEINPLKYKKVITAKGKIKNIYSNNQQLNNLRLQTLETLNISIPELKDIKGAKADVNADLTVNGSAANPILQGIINVSNLEIPAYFVKAQNAIITLGKSSINAKIDSLKLKNMDISVDTSAPTDFLTTNKINSLKISAGYLDLDYLMSLMQLFNQSKYSPGIDFPFVISSGKLSIKSFKMGDIKAQNITGDISSQKNILYIKNLFATAYSGKTGGKITYNFPYSTIQAEIQGRGLDAASAARDIMPKEQQISGKLNFDASVNMMGTTSLQQMKTLKGRADVVIQNGHLGQLGRFEHFLYAQNLLSQRLIYASLNSAKQAISPKDTGRFTYLKGMLKFSNGYVFLNPVITAGPQMSMYITGNLSLLNNDADLQILGRVSSEVSGSLGLLGSMTIKDFLDEHTKYGQTIANLFNFCNSELPEMDISKIPDLNPDLRYQTKNFRVLIIGDSQSVKAVKSFTWVNPPGTKQKALKEKTEAQEPPSKYSVTPQQPVIQSRPMQQTTPPQSKPADFLNSIPDNFE